MYTEHDIRPAKLRKVASVAVVNRNKTLILHRVDDDFLWPGCWDIPGGRVETGESFRDGALRELREETGIVVKDLRKPMVFEPLNSRPPGTTDMDYRGPPTKMKEAAYAAYLDVMPDVKLDPKEHSEFRWITDGELSGHIFGPGRIAVIRAAFKNKS